MSGGMYVTLSFLVTFGVPVWLCMAPIRDSRGGSGRSGPEAPDPVPPTTPSLVNPVQRPLPDCLIPRPGLLSPDAGGAGKVRELEPA